jgi:hypothetical protein
MVSTVMPVRSETRNTVRFIDRKQSAGRGAAGSLGFVAAGFAGPDSYTANVARRKPQGGR